MLAAKISRRKWSLGTAATHVGCLKAQMSKWLLGDGRPGLEWAIALRDKFGIPVDAWMVASSPEESGVTLDSVPPPSTGTHG